MTRPNSSHTGKRRKNRGRVQRATAPQLSRESYTALQELAGVTFKDTSLLDRAMTHTSAVPGDAARWSSERLEFLGDRVLGLVVANQLLQRFELEREGGLAPRLNALVNRDACAAVAVALGLGRFLILDNAERARGGANRASILSDATEALIGAIYLDAGLTAAERFINRHWKENFKALTETPRDPKSALQEWAQGGGRPMPVYENVGRSGPDHAPEFTAKVIVEGIEPVQGVGASKQEAQRAAARAMLESIGEKV